MRLRVNKSSLSRDYFLFVIVITVAVMALSIWFSWLIYVSQRQEIDQKLTLEGNRAEHAITESFNYVSHLGRFFGEKIADTEGRDYDFIWSLLRDKLTTDAIAQNLFSWTFFDWINEDNLMRVSTNHGVLTEWKDMSFRSYITQAHKEPWKLHFSDPAIGVPSGEWIIPAGFGVTSKQGKFLGTIGMGFNISRLSHKIESTFTVHGVNFVLLNMEGNIVLQSPQNSLDLAKKYFDETLKLMDFSKEKSGYLKGMVSYNGVDYFYYRKLQDYPFILLMGYERSVKHQEATSVLIPRIASFFVIGSISLILLLVLRQMIVKPIVKLSDAADKVSHGELEVVIPKSGTYEIENLARQLENVIKYIEELQRVREELIKKSEAAESANRAKSEFLACMSHELRTPLNAVIAFSEILKEEMFGPLGNQKYLEYARDIFGSGSHLLSIINDILDLSKAEAGMITLQKDKVNIGDAVNDCVGLVKERAGKNGVTIDVKVQDTLPLLLMDELRLKQILINLLSNAVKFTPEGGHVNIAAHTVKKNDKIADLFITILDTGIGMEPHHIPRAIEKFGQLDTGLNRKFEGTGLGLPLTKKLVELHQGNLTIESEVNKGTTVTLHFPEGQMVQSV